MDKPSKRADNFGTYLNTVSKPRSGVEIRAEVAPMKILEVLSQSPTAANILDIATLSGFSISQTVMALNTLQQAKLVALGDGDDTVSLTSSGQTLANISLPELQSDIG